MCVCVCVRERERDFVCETLCVYVCHCVRACLRVCGWVGGGEKNIQCANTHNYTKQWYTSIQNIGKVNKHFRKKYGKNTRTQDHVHMRTYTHNPWSTTVSDLVYCLLSGYVNMFY